MVVQLASIIFALNSGNDHRAELCSGVGAPGSITHGVVPCRSKKCPGVLLAVE